MALDPEELKRRRAEREAQRAQRKKKLILRLCIALGVLILCGVLIFVLLPGLSGESAADTALPQESTLPGQTESTEPPPTTTVHLAFAGDLNVTDMVVSSGGPSYDFTDVFLDVMPLLADADLTALNLEGNLCGTTYGTSTASAPQTLAEALRSAGVDLVQLANSYSISRGLSGLSSTIDGIRQAGMEPLGVYKDRADFRAQKGYTIRDVQGVKIAFVAFTKGMDGMALPAGSEDCVNLLYTDYESTYQDEDTEGITAILQAVAEEKPDITVAMLHWGSEYNDLISDSQKALVTLLQSNGVDAIIGTHSHFVQKMEYDAENGTFVAYSLGDFLGDAQRGGTQYSVVLDLEVTKDNHTGEATISGYHYTPIYTIRKNHSTLQILRIREAMEAYDNGFIGSVPADVYEDMAASLSRLEDRTTGE